jgi:hypothetical protein
LIYVKRLKPKAFVRVFDLAQGETAQMNMKYSFNDWIDESIHRAD